MTPLGRGIISSGKLGGGVTPPTLNPDDVSGLAQWYDFSDISTGYTDAGITNITADGDQIYQYEDKSGSGDLARQTNSADRPEFDTTGNPAGMARFNASNTEFMVLDKPSFFADPTDMTFLIVIQTDDLASTQSFYSCFDNGGGSDNGGFYVRTTSSGNVQIGVFDTGTGFIFTSIPTDTNRHLVGIKVDGADVEIYYDGSLDTQFTMADNFDLSFDNLLNIGRNEPDTNLYVNGQIGEIVMYNNDISASDLEGVSNGLISKWSI